MEQQWRDFWNERYAQDGAFFGEAPLAFLKDSVSLFPPQGKILLPADGDGRNGVFLARQGFDVHSFDGSSAGVQKALAAAQHYSVPLQADVSAVEEFSFTPDSYDGVVVSYFHLMPDLRHDIHAKYVRCLKTGGLLLLEGFRKEQLNYSSGGPQEEEMLFSEETLREDFGMMEILRLENSVETLNSGRHQGDGAIIRLVARKI
ncbi:MAG: class I SAM-dependent methyltransferase [Alphaproteobacteria bacterium]|nr:MAG: class I SAM-dependent methyltransferase [Alphaproteobacteria bacterium]